MIDFSMVYFRCFVLLRSRSCDQWVTDFFDSNYPEPLTLRLVVLIPVNHYGSKYVVASQESLMRARDERVALMNEVRLVKFTHSMSTQTKPQILGAIRMLKVRIFYYFTHSIRKLSISASLWRGSEALNGKHWASGRRSWSIKSRAILFRCVYALR